jgi:polar amino acid transport system substrate-binding protein
MTSQIRRGATLAMVAALLGSTLVACSSGSPEAQSTESDTFEIYGAEVPFDQELRDMLPPDVLDTNVLAFSTAAAQPPRAFIDEQGEIAGVIPDMLYAIGARLGVEIEITNDPFDAQVPGVESGRFDATTDTADLPTRREVFDMIDWFGGGWAYLTSSGNPHDLGDDPLDQCGLRIGLLQGGPLIEEAEKLKQTCVDAGKEPVETSIFTGVALTVPLKADRVDVIWDGAAGSVFLAKTQPENFALAGKVKNVAYQAFGVKKDRQELRDTLQATLQKLLDDGAYMAIAEHWDQEEFVIDYVSVNSDPRP